MAVGKEKVEEEKKKKRPRMTSASETPLNENCKIKLIGGGRVLTNGP